MPVINPTGPVLGSIGTSDRVKETSTSTGTGAFTLAGASPGYVSFNSKFGTTQAFYYAIVGATEWEVGVGQLTDATTLTRIRVINNSLGTTALINFSAGTADVFSTYPQEKAQLPNRQVFDASGTWTKPRGATFVRVKVWSGGGGGGGGFSATNGQAGGGAGGSSGRMLEYNFAADDLPSTVSVTVGAGGAGGTAGTSGSSGGSTLFGSFLSALGAVNGGGAGTATNAGVSPLDNPSLQALALSAMLQAFTNGGNGSLTGAGINADAGSGPGAGGGGAGSAATFVARNGGIGSGGGARYLSGLVQNSSFANSLATAGGVGADPVGGNGGNGASKFNGGDGGGGGGNGVTQGGSGGNGGVPGGGGGGGGGAQNGTGGTGGNGANGRVEVIAW